MKNCSTMNTKQVNNNSNQNQRTGKKRTAPKFCNMKQNQRENFNVFFFLNIMTNFFFFKKATQSVCVCEWNSWKPKIQTQGVEFTEEGKGTNLGVFIRITSFSYSFKDEGQSISTILVFQITGETHTKKSLKTRAKTKALEVPRP